METESESIEISSIKWAALRPVESIARSDSQRDFWANTHMKAIQDAFEQSLRSTEESTTCTTVQPVRHTTQLDSIACLASTVPESQFIVRAETILQTIPAPEVSNVLKGLQKMSSPATSPHDTQPLSQSIYETIINKTRSAQQLGLKGHQSNGPDITQGTLNEGDDGHIDLLSSYVPPERADEDGDFDIEGFSPTQTQTCLPEFPESQRFKTPATAGKKRHYNGEIINTPALPRNPLARRGCPTPGKIMGLSQAFAATQAASSPLLNGPPHLLPSDLPSPDIELQTRPVMISSSSPLLEFHRSGNEPLARYVPIKQSQAERELRTESSKEEDNEEASDDDFDSVPSLVMRQRRQKERELAAQRQLKAASSPNCPRTRDIKGQISSSPAKVRFSSPRSSPHGYGRRSRPLFVPRLAREDTSTPAEKARESEEETDHEAEEGIAVKRSSQGPPLTEEDKENAPYEPDTVRVPETTVRLQQVINGFTREESSPSIRHSSERSSRETRSLQQVREEAFAVADSQSSQLHRVPLFQSKPRLISSGEGTEVIPQSQPAPRGTTASQGVTDTTSIDGPVVSMADVRQNDDTIPETSSAVLENRAVSSISNSDPSKNRSPRSSTQFETAPSHKSQPTTVHNLRSSSKIILSPARGNKRKNMAEILAQISPERSSSQAVREMMTDFQDNELQDLLGSQSPIRPGRHSKRRRIDIVRPEGQDLKPLLTDHVRRGKPSQLEVLDVSDAELEHWQNATPVQRHSTKSAGTDNASTLEYLPDKQAPHNSILNSKPKRQPGRSVRSVWEVEASPEAKKHTPSMPHAPAVEKPRPRRLNNMKSAQHLQSLAQPQPIRPLRNSVDNDAVEEIASNAPAVSESRGQDICRRSAEITAPNQVWACFNGKTRAYYPARCLGISGSDVLKYRVQWEGYAPDEVEAHGVRRLDLRIGDAVKVHLEGFPKFTHTIRGFKDKIPPNDIGSVVTDACGYRSLQVAPKQRKNLPADLDLDVVKEVPVAAIYLDSNMWGQMKDRNSEYTPPAASQTQPRFVTPMERPSTPSTPSSRSRRNAIDATAIQPLDATGIFFNMAFAISYDDADRKSILTTLLKTNGGLILTEGFHQLLRADCMELKPRFANLGFTVLLADRHSRKEKYIQALALNMPCISGKWIEACIKEQRLVEWRSFLLPAGDSLMLEGATRSRVMPDIPPVETKLSDFLSSRLNILGGASVIVVMGKGKAAEEKRKPYRFLTKALGAGRIETVVDAKAAKILCDEDKGKFIWVFVDDRDVEKAKQEFEKGAKRINTPRIVGNEFIVQSLISQRMYEE